MRSFRRHSLALAGITLTFGMSLYAGTSIAASTFLLQFGEHKTETEARNQWDNIRSANPEILNSMQFRLGEVSEGEETRYRTQATGPASRTDAQDACAKLASASVECLVVETSMYQPAAAATPELKIEEAKPTTAAELAVPPAPPAPLAAKESLEPVEEIVAEGHEVLESDVAADRAAPIERPITESKSFKETLMPWLGDAKNEAPAEVVAAPVAETPAPAAASEPAKFEPEANAASAPASSDAMDESFLSKISQSFSGAVSEDARPAASTQELAARAPKNLAASGAPVEVAAAPQVQPEAPLAGNLQGEVEVAEAVRVPLSFGGGVPVPANKPVGYGGFPSQPAIGRTLWVQVGNFTDKESAMAYWQELSYRQPDDTRLLRVRVISPWKTRYAAPRTSLRLGPLATQDDVNRLCAGAQAKNLQCTLVNEMGTSASQVAGVARSRITNSEQYNRFNAKPRQHATAGSTGRSMFWLQLGAFSDVAEAQERWSQLHSVHADVLGRFQPQISYPALGSAAKPLYHLRTGPFVASAAASAVCDQLKARRLGCVVVQGR